MPIPAQVDEKLRRGDNDEGLKEPLLKIIDGPLFDHPEP